MKYAAKHKNEYKANKMWLRASKLLSATVKTFKININECPKIKANKMRYKNKPSDK